MFSLKIKTPLMASTILLGALCSSLSFASTEAVKNTNMLDVAKWSATTDSVGSSFKSTDPLVSNGQIEVEFTLAKKAKNGDWPYAELICATGKPLATVKAVEITYRSESAISVKFSQSDFGYAGDNSYAHYQTSIPAASSWKTVTLDVNDFKQPNWAPNASKKIKLNLGNVKDIYLSPQLNYNTGETKTLAVKSLRLL